MSKWAVEVRYQEDDTVEHTVCPEGMGKIRASHVQDGVNINLDHDRFYTELVEVVDTIHGASER